jgi:hypothetical protein
LLGLSAPAATNAPAIQQPAEQVPVEQTSPVPQLVPFAPVLAVPVSVHTGAPVLHESTPWSQGLDGVQLLPSAQAMQAPFEQTSPVPQELPFAPALGVPVSVQMGEPVEHEMLPKSHGLAGVQLAPVTHATQVPFEQTRPFPHAEPLASGVPVSLQTAAPVEQEIWPTSQGLAGVQLAPFVQATQLPPEQTRSAPQLVPFGTG